MKRFHITKSTLKTTEEDYSAEKLAKLGKIGFEDNGYEIQELDETTFVARKKDETVYMQYHDITSITVFEDYDELTALGFTRQSKSMWRKGDVTYQNGKFYRNGKEITKEEGVK